MVRLGVATKNADGWTCRQWVVLSQCGMSGIRRAASPPSTAQMRTFRWDGRDRKVRVSVVAPGHSLQATREHKCGRGRKASETVRVSTVLKEDE